MVGVTFHIAGITVYTGVLAANIGVQTVIYTYKTATVQNGLTKNLLHNNQGEP